MRGIQSIRLNFFPRLPSIFGFVLAAVIGGGLGLGRLSAGDDGDLYWRRTHPGEWSGFLAAPSDHSDELAGTVPAISVNIAPKAPSRPRQMLYSGVDPTNLGKGDWIWQIPACQTALGVNSVQGIIDYEVARGMKWITVKCGDGSSIWTQFNADLITRAHNAGLKIFGWAYVYGNSVQGEINVALNALNLGADGFIIDAETEYEVLANNSAAAAQYCQGIRAAYPDRFLAHAPYPIISSHSGFPYITFGRYCDAVMPQAYWKDIGNTPTFMVTRMNSEWRTWQNSLTGADTNAIKPIIPIGQGYASVNGAIAAGEVHSFFNALKTNTPSATAGGYKGASFWSCQHHSSIVWDEMAAATIGTSNNPPVIITPPLPRSTGVGSNAVFSISAAGDAPISYQWRLNGMNLVGETAASLSRNNLQLSQAGDYSVVTTNLFGSATSPVAKLVVNRPVVWQAQFSDDFETNSAARWNLFQGSGNGVSDYAADWSFDYAAVKYSFNGATNFIPAAPGSVTKRALKLAVNKNDATAATAGVSLYPKGQSFSGNHALRCDLWINYNGPPGGGSGSTEFVTMGLNHAGTRVNWGAGSASASDGVWFGVDGEGGASSDYLAYVGNPSGNPTSLPFASSGFAANGAQGVDDGDLFFQGLFPASPYETAGVPGKRWVRAEISQIDGILTWKLGGVVVAQRTNNSAFTSGTAMIGYMDTFTSIANPAADNFLLVDNVQILTEVLPPVLLTHPQPLTINAGARATFSVSASGTAPFATQWKLDGATVSIGTNLQLLLTNVALAQAGNYSVVVTNLAGSATSSNARLGVAQMRIDQLSSTATNGVWLLTATGAPGTNYSAEVSTNLVDWTTVASLVNSNGILQFLDVLATDASLRFYRFSAPK